MVTYKKKYLFNTFVILPSIFFTAFLMADSQIDFDAALASALKAPTNQSEQDEELTYFTQAYENLRKKSGNAASIFDSADRNLLMAAAQVGNEPIVKYLLNHKFDVNARNDSQANTALMYAIAADPSKVSKETQKSIINKMLAHDADVNAVNSKGMTPLMIASKSGNKELIELLLPKTKNPNAQDQTGLTALMLAPNPDTISLLLQDNRIDPNMQDANGRTILMRKILQRDKASVVTLLSNSRVLAGINLQDKDANGAPNYSALFYALYGCTAWAVDVNSGNKVPGCCATDPGNVELLTFLLAHGANVNLKSAPSNQSNTPLLEAVKGCYQFVYANGKCICTQKAKMDSMKVLLNAPNIDLSIPDTTVVNGKTIHTTVFEYILNAAIPTKDYSLFKFVLSKAPQAIKNRLAFKVATLGLGDILDIILAYGVPLDSADENGKTLLMYAAQASPENSAMISKLLAGSKFVLADLARILKMLNAVDKNGMTPLMYAAMRGNTDTARIIIEKIASIYGLQAPFNTIYHNPGAKKGIDFVNQKSKAGLTALMFAAAAQDMVLVKWLLEAGADPTVNAAVESLQKAQANAQLVDTGKVQITAADFMSPEAVGSVPIETGIPFWSPENINKYKDVFKAIQKLYNPAAKFPLFWHGYNKLIFDTFPGPKWPGVE